MNLATAISQLYPQVIRIVGLDNPVAYDANGNEVTYDLQAVTEKVEAETQAAIDVKNSALAKLAALGLTQDEVKALFG